MKQLTAYPAYRPSSTPWLGNVPAHWEVQPLKHAVQINPEALSEDTDPEYTFNYMDINSVGSGYLVTAPVRQKFGSAPSRARRVVRRGDTAISTVRTYLKAAYHLKRDWPDFIASTGFAVLRPPAAIVPAMLGHFVQSHAFISQVMSNSVGVAYPAINETKLGTLILPLPLPPEQRAIVRYLDYVNRRIRRYISAKEKLITLLEEEKQAIVNRAVTRGLDPNVGLKPSRVEWLGTVPVHWKVKRLRSLAKIKTGGRDTVNRRDDGKYPFFVRSQTIERIDTWSFDGEAVLTAGDGVGVGKVFHYINGKFDYHQRVYKFSDFCTVYGKFFYHYFRSALRHEVLQGTAKSTVDSLRLPMLQNFPVALPPLTEQSIIVEYLDKATAAKDLAIARTRRQIDLVQEYRTRLIADVVTGKLDVREAAAQLPEEPDYEDPTQETDPLAHVPYEDFSGANYSEDKAPIEAPI